MRTKKRQPSSSLVDVEIDGKSYSGSYYVERGTITVSYGTRRKPTQLGGSSPAALAKILLRELVRADPEEY